MPPFASRRSRPGRDPKRFGAVRPPSDQNAPAVDRRQDRRTAIVRGLRQRYRCPRCPGCPGCLRCGCVSMLICWHVTCYSAYQTAMTSLRRRLRFWAVAWLILQAAPLMALVPRDCCAAHRPAANVKAPSCHEKIAAVMCPMRAADGTPCPMHRGSQNDAEQGSRKKCSVRGTCAGPMAALFRLMSVPGILDGSFIVLPGIHAGSVATVSQESLITRLTPPDPLPPRA
jgi:hypothetical protein